jgi:hypothetical protein
VDEIRRPTTMTKAAASPPGSHEYRASLAATQAPQAKPARV